MNSDRHWQAGAFRLESGLVLPAVKVAYTTLGKLNPQRSNAVLMTHGFTSSHREPVQKRYRHVVVRSGLCLARCVPVLAMNRYDGGQEYPLLLSCHNVLDGVLPSLDKGMAVTYQFKVKVLCVFQIGSDLVARSANKGWSAFNKQGLEQFHFQVATRKVMKCA